MLKSTLDSAIRRIAKRLRLVDSQNETASATLEPFLRTIKQAHFSPMHIMDIGANHGGWTRNVIRYFPNAKYTLVEPQDHLKEHISDLISQRRQIEWIHAAVGDVASEQLFTVANRDDSSSLLPTVEEAKRQGLQQVLVNVRTINEIVLSGGWPTPDLVKIDAEGYDLKALAGASDLYGKTDIFLLEAAVHTVGFENTFSQVMKRMDEIGYHLIDITDLNRSPRHGILWLCELAFLRNESQLLGSIRSYV